MVEMLCWYVAAVGFTMLPVSLIFIIIWRIDFMEKKCSAFDCLKSEDGAGLKFYRRYFLNLDRRLVVWYANVWFFFNSLAVSAGLFFFHMDLFPFSICLCGIIQVPYFPFYILSPFISSYFYGYTFFLRSCFFIVQSKGGIQIDKALFQLPPCLICFFSPCCLHIKNQFLPEEVKVSEGRGEDINH